MEEVSHRSGRLYKVLKIDDNADVECDQMHTRVGFIFYSKSIKVDDLSYYKSVDTATFLPCQPSVKREISSRVAEGSLITDLHKEYISRLPFPPYEVIKSWADTDKDFKLALVEARKHAARVRFDQALQAALDNKDDPKTLKTLVDILRRHAEVDDADTFNVKADVAQAQIPAQIIIMTGVPDTREVIEHERRDEPTSTGVLE